MIACDSDKVFLPGLLHPTAIKMFDKFSKEEELRWQMEHPYGIDCGIKSTSNIFHVFQQPKQHLYHYRSKGMSNSTTKSRCPTRENWDRVSFSPSFWSKRQLMRDAFVERINKWSTILRGIERGRVDSCRFCISWLCRFRNACSNSFGTEEREREMMDIDIRFGDHTIEWLTVMFLVDERSRIWNWKAAQWISWIIEPSNARIMICSQDP